MRRLTLAAAVIGIMLFSTAIMAQKTTKDGKEIKKTIVAVMNFASYGDPNIAQYAKSLPETISSSMASLKEIRLVERTQLGQIVNELTLEQTGLVDTGGIERVGKIAKADVLILGSVSGSSGNITVTIKAVEVATGKLVSGKVINGTNENIVDRTNQASRVIGAIISGVGVGMISVSTTPSQGDVYIDGILVGKSPVVEYKVTAGEHSVKAVKDGYMEYDTTVNLAIDKHEKLTPFLAEHKFFNRTEFAAGAGYLIPMSKDLQNSKYYYAQAGQSFDKVIISFELGYSNIRHDQEIDMALLGKITQERYYDLWIAQLHFKYRLAPSWKYFSPYAGGIIGMTRLYDNRIIRDDATEEIKSYKLWALGLTGGFIALPYSRFSVYVDCRYYYHPQSVDRLEYTQTTPGKLDSKAVSYKLNFLTIGGGATYYF